MISSFDTRLATLLKKLEMAPACDSAESAFSLFTEQWLAANVDHESPEKALAYIRSRRLCAEHGWVGVGSSVCYIDSSEMAHIRLYLHFDGSIVLQRLEPSAGNVILFTKPGRPRRTSADSKRCTSTGVSAD